MVYLSGCAPMPVYPQSVGGSRSDGIINMTYEYGSFTVPDIQWEAANEEAISRCKSWGYKGARAFGGTKEICIDPDVEYGGCNRYQGMITYQCTN